MTKIQTGADLEAWRHSHSLSLEEASSALGSDFRKLASSDAVDYAVELLIALYDMKPGSGAWPAERISVSSLYNAMFAEMISGFDGTPHEVTARVDCEARLAKMLGRSKNTIHQSVTGCRTNLPVTALILGKLSQFKSPAQTLEKVSRSIWAGRGVDIDVMHPVPTLRHPPRRERRGRKTQLTTSI